MEINVKCSCGEVVKVAAANASQLLMCPHCGTQFRVPGQSELPAPEDFNELPQLSAPRRPDGPPRALAHESYSSVPAPAARPPMWVDRKETNQMPVYIGIAAGLGIAFMMMAGVVVWMVLVVNRGPVAVVDSTAGSAGPNPSPTSTNLVTDDISVSNGSSDLFGGMLSSVSEQAAGDSPTTTSEANPYATSSPVTAFVEMTEPMEAGEPKATMNEPETLEDMSGFSGLPTETLDAANELFSDSGNTESPSPTVKSPARIEKHPAEGESFYPGTMPGVVREFFHDDAVAAVAVSPDNKFFVTSAQNGTTILFDAVTGRAHYKIMTPNNAVRKIAYSRSPQYYYAFRPMGVKDCVISRDSRSGQQTRSGMQQVRANGSVANAFAVSSDSASVFAGWSDGQASFWRHGSAGNLMNSVGLDAVDSALRNVPKSAVFSHDDRYLVVGTANGHVVVIDVAGGSLETVGHQRLHSGAVNVVAVVPGGRAIISAGQDSLLRVTTDWMTGNWKPQMLLGGGRAEITAISCAPDGVHMAVGRSDGKLEIWNLESLKRTRNKRMVSSPITALQYFDNGKSIIIGSGDGGVRIIRSSS